MSNLFSHSSYLASMQALELDIGYKSEKGEGSKEEFWVRVSTKLCEKEQSKSQKSVEEIFRSKREQ